MACFLRTNLNMKIYKCLLLIAGAFASMIQITGATIIYSGEQNISLTGQPDSTQKLVIDIAGETNDISDDLTLSISLVAFNSVGANEAGAFSGVALGSSAGSFPLISPLSVSDPFPTNAIFGSGSLLLWQFGTTQDIGLFRNTTGYAAMLINLNQDPSQYLQGWVQLSTSNYSSLAAPFPAIKVVDWAFSDTPGESILIGQRSNVPEGGPSVLGFIAIAGLLWLGRTSLNRRSA
jgi:hypothetical protein